MEERLSTFGEISSLSWTKKNASSWQTASFEGQALYWEWKPDGIGLGPEDFLLFVRTVFPNGGWIVEQHSNNCLIWSPIEGDIYGVGVRKLKHQTVWVVSVLEAPEEYPGASMCPDKILALRAARFIAIEFLRATNPIDIFNCEEFLLKEDASWWEYLSKLEKVVNWKYPELRSFRRRCVDFDEFNRQSKRTSVHDKMQDGGSNEWYGDRYHRDYRSTHSRDRRDRTNRRSDNERSRSPPNRSYDTRGEPLKPTSTKPIQKTGDLHCSRCGVSFEHSYELMRHLNSEQHREALSREFPI